MTVVISCYFWCMCLALFLMATLLLIPLCIHFCWCMCVCCRFLSLLCCVGCCCVGCMLLLDTLVSLRGRRSAAVYSTLVFGVGLTSHPFVSRVVWVLQRFLDIEVLKSASLCHRLLWLNLQQTGEGMSTGCIGMLINVTGCSLSP